MPATLAVPQQRHKPATQKYFIKFAKNISFFLAFYKKKLYIKSREVEKDLHLKDMLNNKAQGNDHKVAGTQETITAQNSTNQGNSRTIKQLAGGEIIKYRIPGYWVEHSEASRKKGLHYLYNWVFEDFVKEDGSVCSWSEGYLGEDYDEALTKAEQDFYKYYENGGKQSSEMVIWELGESVRDKAAAKYVKHMVPVGGFRAE